MKSSLRLVVTVVLLAPVAFACGKREERATTPPPPAGMAATAVPADVAPLAMAPPKGPATTEAAPPPSTPPRPAPQRPPGVITLPARLGAVTFDHQRHAREPGTACTTCHHPSRSQKPLASANQACRDCHTAPPAPSMKTSLQAAFHDPKATSGTCIDCHKKKDGTPVKCLECHEKK